MALHRGFQSIHSNRNRALPPLDTKVAILMCFVITYLASKGRLPPSDDVSRLGVLEAAFSVPDAASTLVCP